MGKIGMSKSKYCQGVQCPKMLWMRHHMPEQAVELNNDTVFENGNKVGELAQQYFGEAVVIDYSDDKQKMIAQTAEVLKTGAENICEASFALDGMYCAVDVLHRNGDGWDIVEVKSSTSVHGIYIHDMAFQYYLLTACGIKVNRVYNMHIDNSYVRHGDLNIQEYFKLEDFTEKVISMYDEVEANVASFRAYAEPDEEPVKDIGTHCDDPYECVYKQYCWKHIPSPSVFDIGRIGKKAFEYYYNGWITYEDLINNNVKLSAKQKIQIDTAVNHSSDVIDKKAIKKFLDTLSYPIYHLDFETFQQPIPEFEGEKPYEQVPFQYSLHIEYEDGTLEHKEFLAKEGTDPRRALAEKLCEDIPMNVCGLAYNMSFEKNVMKKLSEIYPDLAEHLLNIVDHMHDLMTPFADKVYYSEAMQGSYSIKYVLPALYPDDPELDYHNLEGVHKGDEASAAFATLAEKSPEEIEKIREQLLKYCGLDTYAMVKVLGKLKDVVV